MSRQRDPVLFQWRMQIVRNDPPGPAGLLDLVTQLRHGDKPNRRIAGRNELVGLTEALPPHKFFSQQGHQP